MIAARAHAVREYEKHKEGGDEQAQRKRLFDATLLVRLLRGLAVVLAIDSCRRALHLLMA